MRTAAVGVGCLLAGMAIGACALALATDGGDDLPWSSAGDDAEGYVREAHVIVFLDQEATPDERQAIEAAIDADELVSDVEFWDDEASRAEALQIFSDEPEMREKVESGTVAAPTSFRLLLHDPTQPNAVTVQARLSELHGVLNVVTLPDNLSQLGD